MANSRHIFDADKPSHIFHIDTPIADNEYLNSSQYTVPIGISCKQI